MHADRQFFDRFWRNENNSIKTENFHIFRIAKIKWKEYMNLSTIRFIGLTSKFLVVQCTYKYTFYYNEPLPTKQKYQNLTSYEVKGDQIVITITVFCLSYRETSKKNWKLVKIKHYVFYMFWTFSKFNPILYSLDDAS